MRGVFLLGRPLSPSCLQLRATGLRIKRVWYSTPANENGHKLGRSKSRKGLPGHPCRTRFAPSPTGYLHLGSLRTALFSYLLARATNGQFILRIEDTDQKRTIPDAESRLLKDLHWAGLSWDEGPDVSGPYGPYRQSERLGLYWTHIDKLLATGKAYRCFCSIKELEEYARAAEKSGGYGYPGTCRDISPEESEERAANGNRFVVRFRSHETPLFVEDIVFHRFRKKLPEEDFIIMKSDGWPTYHFANVVDDKHMHITHVIRGSEWLPSTPKHLALYKAFDWEAPKFAHVGLLVDANNQKLSKRHLGVDLNYYKSEKRHTLPAALLNFVSLLGWGTKTHNSDIMTLQDMVDRFTLKFTKGDIKVNLDKLQHLQRGHIRRLIESALPQDLPQQQEVLLKPLNEIITRSEDSQSPAYPIGDPLPAVRSDSRDEYLLRVLRTQWGFLPDDYAVAEYVAKNRYLFWEVPRAELARSFAENKLGSAVFDPGSDANISDCLTRAANTLREIPDDTWATGGLDNGVMKRLAEGMKCSMEEGAEPGTAGGYRILRWALVASLPGGTLVDVARLLGKEETIRRFELAAEVALAELTKGEITKGDVAVEEMAVVGGKK